MSDTAIREDLGLIKVGVDLGQLMDYSAISVLRMFKRTKAVTVEDDPNRGVSAFDKFIEYHCIHLDRFQSTYSEALDRIEGVLDHKDVWLDSKEVVMDASGLGQPVVEMAWNRGLEVTPIVITGGESPRYSDGKYFVPRTELISCLIAVFTSERIKISDGLLLKKLLIEELSNLRLKKKPSGAAAYETAAAAEHDDMVLSLAMPIWLAEQQNVQERITLNERDRQRKTGGSYDWANAGLRGNNRGF